VCVLVLCAVLAGCSEAGGGGPDPVPTTPAASASGAPAVTPGPTVPPSSTAAPAPTTAGPLSVAAQPTEYAGERGGTSYTVSLPTIAGPLAEAVNRRVKRSADDAIGEWTDEETDGGPSSFDVAAEVTVNDGRTVQVQLELSFYAEDAAHPTSGVSTVALRRADASPILLSQVFTSSRSALSVALTRASAVAKSEGRIDPAGSLTTDEADWADWQTTPEGITFSFDDYAAGDYASGLRQLDVPWSALRPWVRDDAWALLGPA
jgi:hypothetical protein